MAFEILRDHRLFTKRAVCNENLDVAIFSGESKLDTECSHKPVEKSSNLAEYREEKGLTI